MQSPPRDPASGADESAQPGADKRARADRRREPTGPWDAFSPAGKRQRNRRADEHRRPYYVDRFSPATLTWVLLLVIASIVDAVLTLQLLREGGNEMNPVMDGLLQRGIGPFVVGKYLLTVCGLPLLLIFKNFYLFGTRIRVGHLVPVVVAMYAALIGYQLVLMHRYVGL